MSVEYTLKVCQPATLVPEYGDENVCSDTFAPLASSMEGVAVVIASSKTP
ncbi:TPA: hypothetical protein ACGO4W_002298 [Streptococcus suis]